MTAINSSALAGMALLVILLLFTASPVPTSIQFEDITKSSGLLEPLQGLMGHAAAWGDFDNDGNPDLFVGGFCDRPNSEYQPAKGPLPSLLFRNLGNGNFKSIKNSPTVFYGRTSGAVFVDLNHDGFPELYVANNAKGVVNSAEEPQATAQKTQSRLFENSKGTFKDISQRSGACPSELLTARNIGVFDYNNDGLLDLFVVEDKFKKAKQPARSLLLKNLGNLKFQIANAEAGIPDDIYGLGLAVADLNNDGRPDFFVAHSNRLFLSQPGNRYREATELQNVFRWDPLDKEDWPCGVAFGDPNRDGNLDLVITVHHAPARNKLYINKGLKNGVPQFEDVTDKVGMSQSIPTKSPHVEIQDFDNDGLPDIYTSAAWKDGASVIPLIYHNEGIQNGLPHFKPLREIKPDMVYFPAGPTADFNKDGRLDIFLVSWFPNEPSHLLSNQTKGGNWLEIKAPIGSKIRVTSGGKLVGYQQLYTGYGFASGQLPICHFGLGFLKSVDVEVTYPNGSVKTTKGAVVNQTITLRE